MGIVSQKKVILLNLKKFNVVGFWPFKTIGSIENMVIVVVHLIYVSRVFFDRKKNTYLVDACTPPPNFRARVKCIVMAVVYAGSMQFYGTAVQCWLARLLLLLIIHHKIAVKSFGLQLNQQQQKR